MSAQQDGKHIIRLDNRGLEPPQPMMNILSALNTVPDGGTVIAHNDRAPMFLFPKLEQMGYEYDTDMQDDDSCIITIHKSAAKQP